MTRSAPPGFLLALLLLTPLQAQPQEWRIQGQDALGERFQGQLTLRKEGQEGSVQLHTRSSSGARRYAGSVTEVSPSSLVGSLALIRKGSLTDGLVFGGSLAPHELQLTLDGRDFRATMVSHDSSQLLEFHSVPSVAGERTIVLFHGSTVTPLCWENFRARYEALGYRVLVPAWPCLEEVRQGGELSYRLTPDAKTYGPQEILAHYREVVAAIDPPPILIGHSLGGLFVQLLLDQGHGALGVAIDSAPPQGVVIRGTTILSSLPALTQALFRDVVRVKEREFAIAFLHNMPRESHAEIYRRHYVPTPAKLYRIKNMKHSVVDFERPTRAPLLMIAGEDDLAISRATVYGNYKKYLLKTPSGELVPRPQARVEFREFPGRHHWIIAEPGWEDVADAALYWAERQLDSVREDK